MINKKGWLFFIALIWIEGVKADDVTPCSKALSRPCTALVLGGGGARGGAHLGVIRYLEENNIPVDMVIGTSIGAFVGGLYASGKSPDQIQQILTELNWGAGFRDHVFRDEMPMRRKQQRDHFPIRVDLGMGTDGLKVPKGLLLGQAMNELVQQAYGVQPDFIHFNQLPIPFRAIATNLSNRDTVILQQGSLVASVQASMSIPGVVRPMVLNGLTLVDGGVANNLPISVAQQMGAERIIAVDIEAPLQEAESLNSAFAITQQLTSFLVKQVVSQQITLMQPTDVLLRPEVGDITTLEFEKITQAIDSGEDVAKQAALKLQAFSVAGNEYQRWLAQHRHQPNQSIQIDNLQLVNNTSLSDDVLIDRLNLQTGKAYQTSALTSAIRRVYGLDTLERVSQELYVTEQGINELKVTADEKQWGPGYVNFRFLMDDDFHSNRHVQLAGSYTYTNLSDLGAEWHNEFAVGTDKYFSSELYWPMLSPATFTSAELRWHSESLTLEDQQGLSIGEFFREETVFSTNLGWNISDYAMLTAGWVERRGSYRLPTILVPSFDTSKLHFSRQGYSLSLRWDSLNDANFPTRGVKLSGFRQWLDDDFLDNQSSSTNTVLEFIAAKGWDKHLLKTRWRYDNYDSLSDDIGLEQFSLGGLFNLSGYPHNYLYGPEVKFGSLIYMYKVHENRFSFFNSPFYLGTSLERGWVGENIWLPGNGAKASWLWGGSLFAGWDSPIGPIFVGYGRAEDDYRQRAHQFYLSIGKSY